MDSRSPNCYTKYERPPAWAFFFDESVGILQTVNRRMRIPYVESWIEDRLRRDLGLLYGLRNGLAHAGVRLFSDQMAEYLGQLGLELATTFVDDL